MLPNPSKVAIREAMIAPMDTIRKPMASIAAQASSTRVTESSTPARGANKSTMEPCAVATVAPPNSFPRATESIGAGETRISRMSPTSRSQTSEIADCMDAKMMFRAITPGRMYCVYV